MKKIFILFSIFFFLFSVYSAAATDSTSTDLQSAIDQKNQSLQKINSQIQEIQNNLETTKETKTTLKKEVAKFSLETKQVELGISANQTMIDKLNLGIDDSKNKISDAKGQIAQKKEVITKTIGLLQQADQDNLLAILLKNSALSDKVLAAENLNNLNSQMAKDINDLQSLQKNLNGNIDEMAQQKENKQQESENLKNHKIILNEIKKEKQSLLEETQNREKAYQTQLDELEKQRLAIAAEMEQIEEQLRLKINPNLLPTKRPGVLAYPVENPHMTQGYGATNFASRNYHGKWHNGIDLGAPIGTPVFAAEKGEVIMTGNQDKYCRHAAYGKYIVIKHENNLTTIYGHLSLQIINVGDKVKRGQLIGYVGKTGWATGPHLHFTVWSTQTFFVKQSRSCGPMPVGGDLNPLDYL